MSEPQTLEEEGAAGKRKSRDARIPRGAATLYPLGPADRPLHLPPGCREAVLDRGARGLQRGAEAGKGCRRCLAPQRFPGCNFPPKTTLRRNVAMPSPSGIG